MQKPHKKPTKILNDLLQDDKPYMVQKSFLSTEDREKFLRKFVKDYVNEVKRIQSKHIKLYKKPLNIWQRVKNLWKALTKY
jgi:hypothetical protein